MMGNFLKILLLVNMLLKAEGDCQCNDYMHKNDVVDIGLIDIDVAKGQCRKRTWDLIDCGLFKGWCYVDDSNSCSDSKFSTEGSPYNWSCQACRESTWPYPAPRLIINSTPAPESLADLSQSLPAIVGSLAGCLCIAIAVILVLVMKRRMMRANEEKRDEETK